LSADILDYVLEAALIHMEHSSPPYRLTLADIATCFQKTPAQIWPFLCRLIEADFVSVLGYDGHSSRIPIRQLVLPTTIALRTLEAFQNEADAALQCELSKLQDYVPNSRGNDHASLGSGAE
jgi:hypothetical protein